MAPIADARLWASIVKSARSAAAAMKSPLRAGCRSRSDERPNATSAATAPSAALPLA